MDEQLATQLEHLHSDDPDLRYKAFLYVIDITHQVVDWSYEVWDDLIKQLTHKNPHQRAIAAHVLSNLAKSDPQQKMLGDLNKVFEVTRDEKFVTARHTLQSTWKIAAASDALKEEVINILEERFIMCISEKNGTLIRYDIIEVLKNLYHEIPDPAIKEKAFALIALEENEKYQKKYRNSWREIMRRESKGLKP